jgi:hypothetical protein
MMLSEKLTQSSSRWILLVLALGLAVAMSLSMATAGDAHAKKKKKKGTKTVTQSFSGGLITFPSSGNANPYPSQTNVNFKKPKGGLQDLNLKLSGFSHTFEDDADIMLVAPGGQCVIAMSDAGGNNAASNIEVSLDDEAANSLPDTTVFGSGTFKPTNHLLSGADTFPAPAPDPNSCGTSLTVFDGQNPNGAWKLFVTDDLGGGVGQINNWSLQIQAKVQK